MPEIGNGDAAIEFIRQERGGWVFRFTSFPGELRDGFHSLEVGSGEWCAYSAILPHMYPDSKKLACPGRNREYDDKELVWPDTKSALNDLIDAINAHRPPRTWRNLRARVRAYQKASAAK